MRGLQRLPILIVSMSAARDQTQVLPRRSYCMDYHVHLLCRHLRVVQTNLPRAGGYAREAGLLSSARSSSRLGFSDTSVLGRYPSTGITFEGCVPGAESCARCRVAWRWRIRHPGLCNVGRWQIGGDGYGWPCDGAVIIPVGGDPMKSLFTISSNSRNVTGSTLSSQSRY